MHQDDVKPTWLQRCGLNSASNGSTCCGAVGAGLVAAACLGRYVCSGSWDICSRALWCQSSKLFWAQEEGRAATLQSDPKLHRFPFVFHVTESNCNLCFQVSKPSWHDTASKPLRLRFQAVKKMYNCPQEIANMVENVWIASQVETSAILLSAKGSFAFFVTLPLLVVDEILESNC